jgi:hypothetical protein
VTDGSRYKTFHIILPHHVYASQQFALAPSVVTSHFLHGPFVQPIFNQSFSIRNMFGQRTIVNEIHSLICSLDFQNSLQTTKKDTGFFQPIKYLIHCLSVGTTRFIWLKHCIVQKKKVPQYTHDL